MSTPEGRVKKMVKDLLNVYGVMPAAKAGDAELECDSVGWYFMPSQNGFGVKGIGDFVGHYRGLFWKIETKAPGKDTTGFQKLQIHAVKETGGAVFVIDGPESLRVFEEWLQGVRG